LKNVNQDRALRELELLANLTLKKVPKTKSVLEHISLRRMTIAEDAMTTTLASKLRKRQLWKSLSYRERMIKLHTSCKNNKMSD
jgi:hypothetical protein